MKEGQQMIKDAIVADPLRAVPELIINIIGQFTYTFWPIGTLTNSDQYWSMFLLANQPIDRLYDKVWDGVMIWVPQEPKFDVHFLPTKSPSSLPNHAYI